LIDYNVYYKASGTPSFRSRYYGSPSYYETTLSAWQSHGFDINSNMADPAFVNSGGNSAADYKRLSYTLDGRGEPYATVKGAYITGDEIIGYVAESFSSPVISPPQNLAPVLINK
jgi:hypothetical protein